MCLFYSPLQRSYLKNFFISYVYTRVGRWVGGWLKVRRGTCRYVDDLFWIMKHAYKCEQYAVNTNKNSNYKSRSRHSNKMIGIVRLE